MQAEDFGQISGRVVRFDWVLQKQKTHTAMQTVLLLGLVPLTEDE
jgi:hypothetical protein